MNPTRLTVAQVAEIKGINRCNVIRAIKSGKCKSVKSVIGFGGKAYNIDLNDEYISPTERAHYLQLDTSDSTKTGGQFSSSANMSVTIGAEGSSTLAPSLKRITRKEQKIWKDLRELRDMRSNALFKATKDEDHKLFLQFMVYDIEVIVRGLEQIRAEQCIHLFEDQQIESTQRVLNNMKDDFLRDLHG